MMDDKRDFAEAIMLLEGIFGTEFPLDAENFATTSNVVDWFEAHLRGWGPNAEARSLLKELAQSHGNPQLAEDLSDLWRREQIAAIVRELLES
jgi:hypothetical protein